MKDKKSWFKVETYIEDETRHIIKDYEYDLKTDRTQIAMMMTEIESIKKELLEWFDSIKPAVAYNEIRENVGKD